MHFLKMSILHKKKVSFTLGFTQSLCIAYHSRLRIKTPNVTQKALLLVSIIETNVYIPKCCIHK